MDETQLLFRFKREFEASGGVLHVLKDRGSLNEFLIQMVKKENVKSYGISQDVPLNKEINTLFKNLGLERSKEYTGLDLGITRAHGAGASTGTLVFVFKEENDHLLTSLPRVHLAVMMMEDLKERVSYAAIPYLRAPRGPYPYISLVTGPSRTGDIELTHVTGVHGPEKLYLVVS